MGFWSNELNLNINHLPWPTFSMIFRRDDEFSLGKHRKSANRRKIRTVLLQMLLLVLFTVMIVHENDLDINLLPFRSGTSVGGGCLANALSISATTTRTCQRRRDGTQSPFQFSSKDPRVTKLLMDASDSSEESTQESTTSPATIEWIPSRIEFEGVYRSYGPPSLWRKLTSSVPRREYALENITLAFGSNTHHSDESTNNNNEAAVCLLLGASSSGKSTVFRSILEAGNERKGEFGSAENKGCVVLEPAKTARPVLLDDRGEVNELSSGRPPSTTVHEAWQACARDALGTGRNAEDAVARSRASVLVDILAETVLELDPGARLVDLTPSERYRHCLGLACLESSLARNEGEMQNLPGPILLLDEWMDVETSAVVQKVVPSLHKIVEELSGIVLSITHKPELYASTKKGLRRITLNAGKLLSDI